MYFSVRSGLEWWVSAAIILAYVGLTVYYRTDPDGTAISPSFSSFTSSHCHHCAMASRLLALCCVRVLISLAEPGFIFLLVISVVTYVVCLALGQFWPRLPFAPHRFFWNDSSFPHRRERLAKLAHLYLGRVCAPSSAPSPTPHDLHRRASSSLEREADVDHDMH
jgi:hypothetical protein